MIKVRFHLGRGANYMNWQVTYNLGTKFYFDPKQHSLTMYDCTLHNAPSVAKKIWCGATKTVCSWVECKHIKIEECKIINDLENYEHIRYNPRFLPYWTNDLGQNLDGHKFNILTSINNKIYRKIG